MQTLSAKFQEPGVVCGCVEFGDFVFERDILTPQEHPGASGVTVEKGTHELDQGKEREGPLEMVSPANGIAIGFAVRDGDKRKNGDRFQSQSGFLEVQNVCVYRRSGVSPQDAGEPRAAQQSDPSRGGA